MTLLSKLSDTNRHVSLFLCRGFGSVSLNRSSSNGRKVHDQLMRCRRSRVTEYRTCSLALPFGAERRVLSTSASLHGCWGASSVHDTSDPLDYASVHRRSLEDPEGFWDEIAQEVDWFVPYSQVLDNSNQPFTKWFVGGQLNTCHNAVDRHVLAGHGSKTAIIHDSPVTKSVKKVSYHELQDQVARLAGALARLGVRKGDTVLIYMPMVAEAVVAMLATVRLGAVHSVVFGGFAAPELATRITHLEPRVVITASCGVEPTRLVYYKPMLDEALEITSHKPQGCVVLQRMGLHTAELEKGRDHDWEELLATAAPHDPVPVDANDPCYVLYTSGTTGEPKGIVRPTGGHAVVLPWSMRAIYGMRPEDTWWSASDLGWIVGHSYICYAPLFSGSTTIIYEGKPVGTPDAGQFFRVVRDHNVRGMFTAPTALRAISREDPEASEGAKYDISSLKYLFVAGEPLDHDTRAWAEKAFRVPCLDNWWQTETGYAITANAVGLGMSQAPPRNASGKPFVGFDVRVIADSGKEAASGELGRILCKLPLPPGTMSTLLKAEDRFLSTYFTSYPGYYDTMDAGVRDEQGYIAVMSRDDDVINVAGHRLSTLALEEAVLNHPDVTDVAVVGVPDAMKGQVPFAFYVLRKDCMRGEEEMAKELVAVVRRVVGPVAAFRLGAQVPGLPRTRSGKTARKSMADLAQDKTIRISPAIEDPSLYRHVLEALRRNGFALNAEDPLQSRG